MVDESVRKKIVVVLNKRCLPRWFDVLVTGLQDEEALYQRGARPNCVGDSTPHLVVKQEFPAAEDAPK
jgi:hypothetical protein